MCDEFLEQNNINMTWSSFRKNIIKYSTIKLAYKPNCIGELAVERKKLYEYYWSVYKDTTFAEFKQITGFEYNISDLLNKLKRHVPDYSRKKHQDNLIKLNKIK